MLEGVADFVLNVVEVKRFWFVGFDVVALNLRWCWCSKLGLLVLMRNIFQKKRFCFILETLNLRWVRQGF